MECKQVCTEFACSFYPVGAAQYYNYDVNLRTGQLIQRQPGRRQGN